MMSMMMMMGNGAVEEMMENGSVGGSFGSGSEQAEDPKSGNEFDANELQDDEQQQPPPAKKKRYHRHTNRQIQEMEAYVSTFLHSLLIILFSPIWFLVLSRTFLLRLKILGNVTNVDQKKKYIY